MSTPAVPVTPAPRLALLDLLRFIAALAVMAFHFTVYPYAYGWGQPANEVFPELSHLTVYGSLGVQLFFVVSGFVILMSAWGRSVGQFVGSRVARLFPAYWVSVLSSGILLALILGTEIEPRRIVMNLTMIQTPFGVPNLDGVYWTLWVELCFYLLIGVLLVRGLSYGKVVALIGLWPLAAVMLGTTEGFLGQLLQPYYAPLFAGGMALFLIYRYGHSLLHWFLVVLNVVLAVQQTVTGNGTWTGGTVGVPMHHAVTSAIVVACFALVAVATLTPARTWSGKVGTFLGRLTYPLYLLHANWGLLIIMWTHEWAGRWGAIIIAAIGVIVLAWIVNRFVEKPLATPMRRSIESAFRR